MSSEEARRTAAHLHDRLGDALRTVVVVTADDWAVSYLRDDLRAEYDPASYEEVLRRFQQNGSFDGPTTGDSPIGERRAVVHYYENAFVIQLPLAEDAALLVSVSPDAGGQLLEFIESCRQLVQEASLELRGGKRADSPICRRVHTTYTKR